MATTYDVIVVGAGVEGSATAYSLRKKGLNVLLLEQFSALHNRGSSHGQSRITRRAYPQPHYVRMMNDAYTLWSQLEKEIGTFLFKQTGVLVFGPSKNRDVASTAKSLASAQVPHQQFNGGEANRRYPQQLKLPDDYQCVFEDGGGILNSQKVVLAFQTQFQKLGGTLLDHHQVLKIQPGEDVVTVLTSNGTFRARHLVIAAGAWSPGLCSSIGLNLPFTVIRAEVNYWKVEDPALFTPDQFPVFVAFTDKKSEDEYFHGIPIQEHPGLFKVCAHGGPMIADPDSINSPGGPATVESLKHFISGSFRGVFTDSPAITEYCMYCETPDKDPVIDRHPFHTNIIIASGFSGHGFKLSPVVGKMISEMVTGETPSHDLHPFRVARFPIHIPEPFAKGP